MKAAVLNGMFTNQVDPIRSSCPTGNCTWPQTSSLAVCGQCVNSSYVTSCLDPFDGTRPSAGKICNYTMPSGSVSTFAWGDNEKIYSVFRVLPSKGSHFNSNASNRLWLANFDLFGAPLNVDVTKPSTDITWPNASSISSECALWICAQIYDTTMNSGLQAQTVVSTVDDAVMLNGREDNNIPFWTFTPFPNDVIGANLTNFNVSGAARLSLQDYLGGLFNGSSNVVESAYTSTSSDAVQAIWNGTVNLDGWMQNLATSISNIIRTDIPSARDVFDGTAYELGYVVRWNWLILPAALVLLSFLLWIAIMVQTARSPVAAWKGSPLTLLLFGVDEEVKKDVGGQIDKYRGIKSAIGKKNMVLAGRPGEIREFQVDRAFRRGE